MGLGLAASPSNGEARFAFRRFFVILSAMESKQIYPMGADS